MTKAEWLEAAEEVLKKIATPPEMSIRKMTEKIQAACYDVESAACPGYTFERTVEPLRVCEAWDYAEGKCSLNALFETAYELLSNGEE